MGLTQKMDILCIYCLMIPIHSGDVPFIFGAFDFVYSSIANNVKGYTLYQ